MTDLEIFHWLELLAPTNRERSSIIQDLLQHRLEDHMSAVDIVACLRALDLMQRGVITDARRSGLWRFCSRREAEWGTA